MVIPTIFSILSVRRMASFIYTSFFLFIVIYIKSQCIIHILCISIPTKKVRFSKSIVENGVKNDQSLSCAKPSFVRSIFWDKFQEILVNNVCQGFIICNDCSLTLTWTSSNRTNIMKKHSISCIKAKDPTPETQSRITSLFKETSQVTPQQLRFCKNNFFTMLLKYAYWIQDLSMLLMEKVLKNFLDI